MEYIVPYNKENKYTYITLFPNNNDIMANMLTSAPPIPLVINNMNDKTISVIIASII